MKRLSSVLFGAALILGLTILLAVPNLAEAFNSFRCGTKVVRIGDTKTDIEKSCGPPTSKTLRTATGGAEVWIYNLGSNKTMRKLIFTGPNVTAIIGSNNYGFVNK
jgi:hypothetical protein